MSTQAASLPYTHIVTKNFAGGGREFRIGDKFNANEGGPYRNLDTLVRTKFLQPVVGEPVASIAPDDDEPKKKSK
jgi:hypothetical protein